MLGHRACNSQEEMADDIQKLTIMFATTNYLKVVMDERSETDGCRPAVLDR